MMGNDAMYKYISYYLDRPIVEGRSFDIFEPDEVTRDTAIFMVHGGGWRSGTKTGFHKLMEALCDRGYIVASTDYRLSGTDAFDQLTDIRESYCRFAEYLADNGRPVRIAVHGGSAGAHLASLLLCASPGECGENTDNITNWTNPVCGILQATPADFLPWEGMMPSFWAIMEDIAGAPYEKNPEVYQRLSLVNYIRQDNPPLFFMEAELEHVFLPEHTLHIAKQQRNYGVQSQWKMYDKMEHGFLFELKRAKQKEAFEDFCLFVEGQLNTEI